MAFVAKNIEGINRRYTAYSRHDLSNLTGLFIGYALLSRIGMLFSQDGIPLLHFATGLALTALLIGGYKYLPAIFLGALLPLLTNNDPITYSTCNALNMTLEPLLGAWLLGLAGFDSSLRRNRDFMQLMIKAGIISAGVGALGGGLALYVSGLLTPDKLPGSLFRWWMSDMLGVTLITPILLTWRRLHLGWLRRERRYEFAALLTLAFISGQIIFLDWLQDGIGQYFEEYLLFIYAAWAGLRFGRHGVSLILLLHLGQALAGIYLGVGLLSHTLTAQAVEYNFWSFFAEMGMLGMLLSTTIREKNDASSALQVSEERFHTMFQNNSSAMLLIEPHNGHIVDANRAASEFYGYPEAAFKTMHIGQISVQSEQGMMTVIGEKQNPQLRHYVCSHRLASGELRTVDIYSSPVEVADQLLLFSIVFDITENQRLEKELERRANTDFLTELSNRRHFLECCEQELTRSLRYNSPLSMLLIDADHFKHINDTYGHKAGDVTLKHLADLCRTTLREVDIIGRIGGEEFAVLLPETDGVQAMDVAERLRLAMAYAEVGLDEGISLRFTVSIGIATMHADINTIQGLLKQADLALYEAKYTGRNRVCAHYNRTNDRPVKAGAMPDTRKTSETKGRPVSGE